MRRRTARLDRIGRNPYAPPGLDDAAREVGATSTDVPTLLADRRLMRHGALAFTCEAVGNAASLLSAPERTDGAFTASKARQALGTTRKDVIPLLEILDGLGVTEFDRQRRRVRRG